MTVSEKKHWLKHLKELSALIPKVRYSMELVREQMTEVQAVDYSTPWVGGTGGIHRSPVEAVLVKRQRLYDRIRDNFVQITMEYYARSTSLLEAFQRLPVKDRVFLMFYLTPVTAESYSENLGITTVAFYNNINRIVGDLTLPDQ